MLSSNTSQVADGGYQISRSLRFNSADSAYLNRTPASASNRKTYTFSGWVKVAGNPGNYLNFFLAQSGGTYAYLSFNNSNNIEFASTGDGSTLITSAVYRDYSAWYHIVLAVDTTQATASNRIKLYVNGSQITNFSTATYPSQNADTQFNTTLPHFIGSNATPGNFFIGYATEINFIDGQALTPSSFGETNAQTGVWQPKAYAGSYGTNGFYLNFSDNSNTTATTLGKDYSGNGNNWTPNNFSVAAGAGNDSLVDSPTAYGTDTGAGGTVRGNYCTWSPVDRNPIFTLTNGNLDCAQSAADGSLRATIAVSSGKWYWEITVGTGNTGVGIALVDASLNSYLGGFAGAAGFNMSTGMPLINSPFSGATGSSIGAFATNDIIGLALDFTDGTLKFYRNGTLITANHITNVSGLLAPAIGSNVATSGYIANFGQRPFAYTAPSGFKALCTQNLPTPTIGATTATQAGKYFNPVLYTGNGGTQTVSGVGFQPDFVWIKGRSVAYDHDLFDVLRGTGKWLGSNSTAAEVNVGGEFSAFASDGFTVTNGASIGDNQNAASYVAWNWKANGSGVTNTAGSITSTVSANTTSGFSIVTYTNSTSYPTIGHGLGAIPAFIIAKSRTDATGGWAVYHQALGRSVYLELNSTVGAQSVGNYWGTSAFTSTTFSVGINGFFNNRENMVAYCFAAVAGYSAFGSYTGNGSSDGAFVFTGFRPRYVMVKRTDLAFGWWIFDAARNPANAVDKYIAAESSAAENTFNVLDFTSNGFKFRDASQGWNASGGTYIFAAFAEVPQKFALAR